MKIPKIRGGGIDINGEKAVSVVAKTQTPAAVVTGEKIKTFANFDYITAKVKYTVPSGSYVQVFMRGRYSNAPYTAATTSASDGWTFATIQTNLAQMKDLSTNGMVLWLYSPSEGLVGTDYIISEIRGGYNGITIEENSVDLTQKFGLAQNEFSATFTDIDGNESAVADVTNFNSNVAGTLAVTVNKAGYAQSQFETKISIVSHYGNLLNLSAYKVGSAYSDTATVVDYNGKKALQVVNSGANSSTVRVNIVNDAVLDLKKFDYIRVKVAMKYENASANVNLKLVDSKGSQYAWKNVGGGNNKFIESTVDVATANMTMTSNSLGVTFTKWNAALQTSIITDLYCGYNDITTDSETPLDLTAKLGLAASDFTATFTPENGAEQAVENVAAVDISAAGTLKITVKKSGYAATVLTIGVKAAS